LIGKNKENLYTHKTFKIFRQLILATAFFLLKKSWLPKNQKENLG
jgi:hypothetical protein